MSLQRIHPPFRADQVGSFLRSAAVKKARADFDAGDITAAALTAIEDGEIQSLIRKQEEVGLQPVTDGEFRRSWWHFDFLDGLDGVEIREIDHGIQFHGVQTKPKSPFVTGKIGFSTHPFIEHFKFLAANTTHTPKMTIPSPTVMHWRAESTGISKDIYPHRDAIMDDLAAAYRAAVQAFYDAGCRYLQFDDTTWAYLCSPAELEKARTERGIDTDGLAERYVTLINDCLRDKPADMVITTHVCRGNFKSTWISSGGYEPVAEALLAGCNYDGYFLEYDTERAGGFEPLRFLPKGDKIVVLGLITSKFGELEPVDEIKKRINEATEFVALEQLALSPQCGFASTEDGNELSEEEQWNKMREVVAIADEVWS